MESKDERANSAKALALSGAQRVVPPPTVPLPAWPVPEPLAAGLVSPDGFVAALLDPDLTRVSVFTPVPALGLADWLAVVPEPPAAPAF